MEEHRRTMARLERRAITAHERELLADLRELVVVEAGCSSAVVRAAGLGSIELQLAGRRLVLAGVTRRACAEVRELAASGEMRIVDAGRYDSRWWITITDGRRRVSVLALRAHLQPNTGGVQVVVELVA